MADKNAAGFIKAHYGWEWFWYDGKVLYDDFVGLSRREVEDGPSLHEWCDEKGWKAERLFDGALRLSPK